MRFDAFNCVFTGDLLEIKEGLESLGFEFTHKNKGRFNYDCSASLEHSGNVHGLVCWGGNGGGILVQISGEPSQAWRDWVAPRQEADLMRKAQRRAEGFPETQAWARLKRADVCFDWHDERDVCALQPVLRPEVDTYVWNSTGRDLRWLMYGDQESAAGRQRGCTLTIGSRTSSVYIRIYDKGREMRSKDPDAPDDLRRAEIEFKPASKLEEIEAVMWPIQKFWGVNAATKGLAKFLNISKPQDFDRMYKEPTNSERRRMFLCHQYGSDLMAFFTELYPGVDPLILQDHIARQQEKARRSIRRSA